jgi:uncharacterized phage-associated protein
MPSAFDVAYYLIRLAESGQESDPLTNLRLQKLLYYVQGWALAALRRPMFEERIEAWTNGPVVKKVCQHFKEYGRELISPAQAPTPDGLGNEDRAFIEAVWEAYKRHSATALVSMTHEEGPWREARKGLGPEAHSDEEITHAALRQWFGPMVQSQLIPSLPVAQAYQAVAELDRQPGKRHDEVFAALREGQRRDAIR